MSFMPGETRIEIVACLAATNAGEGANRISKFGPVDEEDKLSELISDLIDMSEEERVDYIVDRIKSLSAMEEFIGLAEIHPAWLVEVLSKESPRIIGIILRYLPSKQVRYIIENLPKRIKRRLPQLIDSFAVPAPILKVIKKRFERQFISVHASRDYDRFGFEEISTLKGEDLETFFKDLGIQELAMALKGLDRRSLHILFNRLSIDEARSLQQRMRSLSDVSPLVVKSAKYTVLEMGLGEANPGELLLDLGLNAFAKSMTKEDLKTFPLIKQKLEPRLGFTLKRYIDDNMSAHVQEAAIKRKEIVLERLETLSRAGSIDEDLVRYITPKVEEEAILPAPTEEAGSCDEDEGVILSN